MNADFEHFPEEAEHDSAESTRDAKDFDYTYVKTTARIAVYDDMQSSPRILEIKPAKTDEYIAALASNVYEQARGLGGQISYRTILEVAENFIHAQFEEIVVSIIDRGNTIRFADQGPGIKNKEHALLPGFSSAIEPMKSYIHGVGSGLPIVKDYLDSRHGHISIEDNLRGGTVITISIDPATAQATAAVPTMPSAGVAPSMSPYTQQGYVAAAQQPMQAPYQAPVAEQRAYQAPQPYQEAPMQGYYDHAQAAPGAQMAAPIPTQVPMQQPARAPFAIPSLSERQQQFLELFYTQGELGITELANLTGYANSSIHNDLKKMEEMNLVSYSKSKKRCLTSYGVSVASFLAR